MIGSRLSVGNLCWIKAASRAWPLLERGAGGARCDRIFCDVTQLRRCCPLYFLLLIQHLVAVPLQGPELSPLRGRRSLNFPQNLYNAISLHKPFWLLLPIITAAVGSDHSIFLLTRYSWHKVLSTYVQVFTISHPTCIFSALALGS